MKTTRFHFTLLTSAVLLVTAAAAPSCSDFSDDCANSGECFGDAGEGGEAGSGAAAGLGGSSSGGSPGGGDGGGAADAGVGGGGPACDVNGAPSVETCLVDETRAIFVAPSGDDEAAGTRDAPVATLLHAVELANEQSKIVIACAGEFRESLTLADGVRVYGGFGCPESTEPWVYHVTQRTLVAPTTRGVALEITDVNTPVRIEDFDFTARDAEDPGESSIAAVIVRSEDVTLRRVRVSAGAGMDGADGEVEANEFPDPAELRGADGGLTSGGEPVECVCMPGATSGNGGGRNGAGSPAFPLQEPPSGQPGNPTLACTAGGDGSDGASGASGPPAPGAMTLGTISERGWEPASGSAAMDGAPGQGGGGGAGKPGGGGGSGGCGGCGGKGGGGGQGGGASIGLLALESRVSISDSVIIAADAGQGGSGIEGRPGQLVAGAGGDGFGVAADQGCDGGNGGPGGAGGAGGGGAGGISVAVLYQGEEPEIVESTSDFGAAGLGGVGGGLDGDAGVDGVAQALLGLD